LTLLVFAFKGHVDYNGPHCRKIYWIEKNCIRQKSVFAAVDLILSCDAT
jgi:hypothetical protein